ncbi:hypothetical protein [Acinetobacter soli]|uniref:hypothetical protein n=1 Tax=Acinetobacter soli TaxID=487316 RepID=UPI0012506BDD|nr:hypothetical protein [Acinetobacter soli]
MRQIHIFFKFVLLLIICSVSKAGQPTDYDYQLLDRGIVDSNFKVINPSAFDAELRVVTNQINSYTPIKLDYLTTLESSMFTRFGFYAIYTVVSNRQSQQYKNDLHDLFRGNICNDAFFNSPTIHQLNVPFTITVYNQNGVKVFNEKFYSSECQ